MSADLFTFASNADGVEVVKVGEGSGTMVVSDDKEVLVATVEGVAFPAESRRDVLIGEVDLGVSGSSS